MMQAGGLTDADLDAARATFAKAQAAVRAEHAAGTLGFLDLPADARLTAQTTTFADRAAGQFEDVVILGIGGSALGPIALRTALRPYQWNSLSKEQRGGFPRLHVLDNVDPESIHRLAHMLAATGQLTPCIGRRINDDRVRLYAGQRRLLAARASHELAGSPEFEGLAPVAGLGQTLFGPGA